MSSKEHRVGMTFNSYAKVKEFMTNYGNENHQVFVTRNANKCGPNCKIKQKIAKEIIYHEVNFACKHGKSHHASTGRIRKKRSLKVNCPARVRFQACNNGKLLRISHVHIQHENHLDTKLDPVPESRKMNKTVQEYVLNAIKLKGNRPCLIQALEENFNITVTLKDLKNFQYKLRTKEEDQLGATIAFLKNQGARIDILREGNTFQGLFFTTSDMKISLAAWGETIYFDGTYKLLMHSLIVLLFVVEDGNFLTEIAGIAIVLLEDQATINWVMASFKKHHDKNVKIIKYFMSDKNATQRQSVQKIFPNIVMLICLFHTIQIFKRQLSKMAITREQKEFYLNKLKKLAYAENIKTYEAELLEMVKDCPDCILLYFFENWDHIKTQWACYNEHYGTFYNRTNNRTESINQKLKQIIDKLSNLLLTITNFLIWKNFHDHENRRKIIRNFGSVLPRKRFEDEENYINLLMDSPAEIVLKELKAKDYITFDGHNINSTIFTINKSNREKTPKECNCSIWVAYQLPCRHMFAVRSALRLPLYEVTLCAKRWTKHFCKQSHRIFMESHSKIEHSSTEVTISEKIHSTTNKIELKIIKVHEIISDLVDVCSCSCGTKFNDKLVILLNLIEIWKKKPDICLTVKLQAANTQISLDFIANKMEHMHLNIRKESINNLSVPEKRKIIKNVLQDEYDIVKEKTERYTMKMFILQKIREGWINDKQLYLQEQQYLSKCEKVNVSTSQCDKDANKTIVLPENFKIAGKPRHALVTNDKYKKKVI